MRIISGTARGRRLSPVPGKGTRPITNRVKGALFSILGQDIEDSTLLDLFAGTGSVGIEALSRGAREVWFVDRVRKALDTLRKNLAVVGLTEGAEVVHDDAFHFIRNAPADLAFDYIYVAPPQYQDLWVKALMLLNDKPLLAPDGLIIVQIHPKEYRELGTANLRVVDKRRYGSTALYFYAAQGADEGTWAAPASATHTDTGAPVEGALASSDGDGGQE